MKRLPRTLALLVLTAARLARADVTVTLVQPADVKGATTGEVRFDLLLLNEDATRPDAYRAPATLAVRLTTADGVAQATATRADRSLGDETVTLAPGAFARVRYVAKLDTVGRVVVEMSGAPGATVVNVGPTGTLPTTVAATEKSSPRDYNPLDAVVQRDPNFKSELGLVEFLGYRVKPHEPVYIVGGNEEPSTKFQISFKYQVFDPNGPLSQKVPGLSGLYFAYSQTSFWDLGGDSSPFTDNSYRPELLLSYDNVDRYLRDGDGGRVLPDWLKLGFQTGIKHESNGRSSDDNSRSLNIVYARPIVTFSGEDGLFLTVAPTVWTYIADLSDNPDIKDYRGYADLRVVMGQGGGVQLAATGRMGDDWQHRSLELDLSFPIRQLTLGNLDVYFHTQYFMGYGESLIRYDKTDYSLRFGVSLVR